MYIFEIYMFYVCYTDFLDFKILCIHILSICVCMRIYMQISIL